MSFEFELQLVRFVMDFLSPLGAYGLRRLLDVVAGILLKLGLRYMDRLVDGGSISAPDMGD